MGPETLKSYQNNFNLIVVTNQGGMKNSAKNFEEKRTSFKSKIEKIFKEIHQVKVIISFESNFYRKPAPGVEKFILENSKTGKFPEKSLFIGDAAGRAAGDGYKKHFAASDYQFALNLGLEFQTPEKYFMNKESRKCKINGFDPRLLKKWEIFDYEPSSEVVILIGYPGTGKSTLAKKYEKSGYKIVNQDILKTRAKCEKEAEKLLKSGEKIVIDRTHTKNIDRNSFVKMASAFDKSVEAVWIDYEIEHVFHNDAYR